MKLQRKVFLAAFLVLACFAAIAQAATYWTCSYCGTTGNTGNFCPHCGAAYTSASSWTCSRCGQSGNTGNYCSNCGSARNSTSTSSRVIYGLAKNKLAINSGPGTRRYFEELGTYDCREQYVQILAKAWDPNNGIWWVEVVIPGRRVTGWTGYKRFDPQSFNLNDVPTEEWY